MTRSIAGVTGDRRIELVLFDLGGVLIDPGGVAPMRALTGIDSDDELWTRWLQCRWVRRFEAGRCTPEEFAAGVVGDWELALEPAAFLEQFRSWPGPPYPGAAELVADVGEVLPVACLSNTNATQWGANETVAAVTGSFALQFLSFELGMVKPDREIFDAVAARLPVARGHVLFLDDNAANVDAAGAAGYVACQVRGVDEARGALAAAGLLAR